MLKIIISVFIILKTWEEEEKCFLEKLKMFQVSISQTKITLELMETIFMKSIYKLTHSI